MEQEGQGEVEEWRDVNHDALRNEWEISTFMRIRKKCNGKITDTTKLVAQPSGYVSKYMNGSLHLVHVLMARTFIDNPSNLLYVDHIDRNPGNNSISNLRWASAANNQHNTTAKRRNGRTSKYKGVCWIKETQCWKAGIVVDGKSLNLGSFDDEKEAAAAYNERARQEHGEFAVLNDVSSVVSYATRRPARRGKYRGVRKQGYRWIVCVHVNGTAVKTRGSFATEREAAIAYNEHAQRLLGPTAKLNELAD